MKSSIMMQTPILRTKKNLENKLERRDGTRNILENEKLFEIPLSPEKKECQKLPQKPRGYKSLHSSEFVELTQLNPK